MVETAALMCCGVGLRGRPKISPSSCAFWWRLAQESRCNRESFYLGWGPIKGAAFAAHGEQGSVNRGMGRVRGACVAVLQTRMHIKRHTRPDTSFPVPVAETAQVALLA